MKFKFFFVGLLMTIFAFNAQANTAEMELPIQEDAKTVVAQTIDVEVLEMDFKCTVEYDITFTYDDGTTVHFEGKVEASNCKKAMKAVRDLTATE